MPRQTRQDQLRKLEEEMLRELPLLHIGRSKPLLIKSSVILRKGRN